MAKSDLLKQAIADAKTVKETALANAKIALQEVFTPRIKEMLANKLTTEIEGEENDELDASIEAGAEVGAEAGVEAGEEMGDDFNWTDDTLAASVGGNDYSFQVGMAGDDEEEAVEEIPVSDEEMEGEYNEGMGDDLELESIIRELEGDLDPEGEEWSDDMGLESEPAEEVFENEEEDLMNMSNIEEGDDDIDDIIESILREAEEEEFVATTTPASEEEEIIEALETELDTKEEELKEAYRTVKHLQSVINEVNLLNAKLLYTNKLFRNFELTEAQKMKVIENFDRAGNTRETKLVFTTLAESFKKPNMKKRIVKESYAAASRPVKTTAPSVETTQILSEGFELANRWKKLAGLL